jgi:hypothetical protein
MEEQSRSMKPNHVPKGPREEAADDGVPVVAAADPEEDEAAVVAVVAAVAADHKVGADEAAVRGFDNHRSVFIRFDPLPDSYGNR